jgi:hypothetical protein
VIRNSGLIKQGQNWIYVKWYLLMKEELAKHRAFAHAINSDEKMFQCQSCSMFFESKEDFEKHAIQHSEKSNYNIGKTVTSDNG